MKAVVVDNKPVYQLQIEKMRSICEANGVEFEALDCANEAEVVQKCQDADAILDVYTKLSAETIQALPNCKAILRFGIGYDIFDVDAATAAGKMVCNIPDYCIEEVATHTVAMILDLLHKVSFLNNSVRGGEWNPNVGYVPRRLSDMTVGFVGFGNIARKAAGYLAPFGCTLIAYDPYLSTESFEEAGAKGVSLDELLKTADIVSLHTPLFESTHHMIDADSLGKMKDGAFLVNTSRGGLVDTEALIAAIASGKIAGAGLDVLEEEPLKDPAHPIFETGRIIVTPHAAFNSKESFGELMEKIAETACNVLNGELDDKTLRRIVNRKELGL
ncbi:MAG: C-terminal binding protein [Clostridia bacterium]|nr:C-terminal binding protein [Clostridia bacterium]